MTRMGNQEESVPFVKVTLTNLTLASEDLKQGLHSHDLGDGTCALSAPISFT